MGGIHNYSLQQMLTVLYQVSHASVAVGTTLQLLWF